MAESEKKESKGNKKREYRTAEDFTMRFPDVEKVWCKDCVFRAKDKGNVKGATLAICDCFPRYDKPLAILFDNVECEYYVDENTN